MIYFVDDNFKFGLHNAFDNRKFYNDKWVSISLINDSDNKVISGKNDYNIFNVQLSKKFKGWELKLMDFIHYEKSYNRNIICKVKKENFMHAKDKYNGHHINDSFLRDYEPKVFVHSTLLENWEEIYKCGYIKSWELAKKDNQLNEDIPIGDKLGDPKEYSNYVMLGSLGVNNEIIVASKQKNELTYDVNQEYKPGVRIYLDAKKLAKSGKLVRDGLHIKVKDKISLDKYMIFYVSGDEIQKNKKWTPIKFSNYADSIYRDKFD